MIANISYSLAPHSSFSSSLWFLGNILQLPPILLSRCYFSDPAGFHIRSWPELRKTDAPTLLLAKDFVSGAVLASSAESAHLSMPTYPPSWVNMKTNAVSLWLFLIYGKHFLSDLFNLILNLYLECLLHMYLTDSNTQVPYIT